MFAKLAVLACIIAAAQAGIIGVPSIATTGIIGHGAPIITAPIAAPIAQPIITRTIAAPIAQPIITSIGHPIAAPITRTIASPYYSTGAIIGRTAPVISSYY